MLKLFYNEVHFSTGVVIWRKTWCVHGSRVGIILNSCSSNWGGRFENRLICCDKVCYFGDAMIMSCIVYEFIEGL